VNVYLKAMRLERWPRSFAIFIGSASFFFLNRDFLFSKGVFWLVSNATAAFLLTWAISTANYIINEIVDVPYDMHHPTKKNRPLVKGEIKKNPFLLYGIILTVFSLSLAFTFFSRPFFLSLALLLVAGFIYNIKPIRTKDVPFLDSISESANNPIRFLIGWFAFSQSNTFPPILLLLCWWAFGNLLMESKRLSELRFLKEKAGDYRASLKKYREKSLILNMALSAAISFATYIYFAVIFKLQSFIYFSPLIFLYFLLIFIKTLREKEVMEEPERLMRDFRFSIYTFFLILLFFLSFFVDKVGQ